jgi:hypothetical protein
MPAYSLSASYPNDTHEPADKTLMVAAIDFGTTYSGYAFSTRHDFSINKLDIKARKQRRKTNNGLQNITQKTKD